MSLFETSLSLARPVGEVFDFFIQPALLIQTAPPELSLQLMEAPERLELGSKVVVRGRRWGIPHRSTMEVTGFEPGQLLVERQVEGTFRKWELTHLFEEEGVGTRVLARVEFEPPGGLLGLTVTEARVRRELEWVFAYRAERLHERFG